MSAVLSKRLSYRFHLIIDEYGSVRTTKREGQLHAGERSIGVQLTVPQDIFRTPLLRAVIAVPDTGSPSEITAQVVASAQTEIRAATGLEVVLTAVKQDDEP